MADTEPIAIVELGVGDAQAGLVLSTEARWNQNEADWRFFLSKGIVFGVRDGDRLVATAALLPYSAGNAWISMVLVTARLAPPRHRDQARRCLPRCGDTARPHHLAGRDAGRRHRLRPARLHADAAIAAAAAGEAARTPKQRGRYRPATSTHLIARDAGAMGFDRSTLLSEFAARPGSRIVSDGRRHRPGPRRTHRAAYRPAARRSRRSGAGAGRRHRRAPRPDPG